MHRLHTVIIKFFLFSQWTLQEKKKKAGKKVGRKRKKDGKKKKGNAFVFPSVQLFYFAFQL